ncbi:MAG: hypothetical protein FIB07_17325 [Candidatus Methanoperedens sp.]|nr:hypothetical protein [Candidatus Methanoperedens sp.]
MVIINQSLTVEKPLLDEIYGLVDEEAKKRGVHEVPVRFVLGEIIHPVQEIQIRARFNLKIRVCRHPIIRQENQSQVLDCWAD